jgi:hypothetical protein
MIASRDLLVSRHVVESLDNVLERLDRLRSSQG